MGHSVPRVHISRGFTLIEVLVVVVVIGIIMATVMSSFTGADREQEMKGIAERLSLKMEMARDRAIQSNREWGLKVDEDQLSFLSFETVNEEWLPRSERTFREEGQNLDMRYRLEVEDYAGQAASSGDEEELLPDVYFFSSGEVSPFTLELESEAVQVRIWSLSSDGFSRIVAERNDDAF